MKKMFCILFFASVSIIYFSSCEKKIDIEKEEQAIKAVFEHERMLSSNKILKAWLTPGLKTRHQ